MASAEQLVEAGVSRYAISRRAARGTLVRMHRGVYAVGHDRLRREGYWMAAVLAGGEGAVLSHRSAAAAWGLRPDNRGVIEVTVQGRRGPQPGLTTHRCRLTPADTTRTEGIPITTVARTLLDLAEVAPYDHLRRAAERAEELRVFDRHAIEAMTTRAEGRKGLKPIHLLLDDLSDGPTNTRSELEAKALELIKHQGLPLPQVNAKLAGYEVDLMWREERLVVELDSWRHHGTKPAFERDRIRDADVQLAGYRVLRLTWRQVTREPRETAERIRAMLAPTGRPGCRS